jgi:hypothetical protein
VQGKTRKERRQAIIGEPQNSPKEPQSSGRPTRKRRKTQLALRELEPAPSTFLAVLLALVTAWIARKEPKLFQLSPKLRIKLDQGASDSQASSSRLAGEPTAVGENHDVEFVSRFGGQQRLAHHRLRRLRRKILVVVPAIYDNVTLSGTQKHAGNGGLSATRAQVLYQVRWHHLPQIFRFACRW